MKILVLTKWLVRWNGASRVAYELSRRFKKEHELRIAVYNGYIDPEWEKEFEIYKLRHKGPLALKEIRELIKEYKPDIIHSHGILGLSKISFDIPLVVTSHSNWPMNWFIDLKSFLAGFVHGIPHEIEMHIADKVISVSKYSQKQLEKRKIKSVVIYNGVDESLFIPPDKKIELNHPALLFVGGIDKRKTRYLLPILKELEKDGSNITVYIIGKPIDNNIVKKLKSYKNAEYLGVVDDVKPFMYAADAFLFTSTIEACPLAPLEAQACGLPVIAFNCCSMNEIIKNGTTGYLVPPADIKKMISMIRYLLEDEEKILAMKRNARNNAKRFLWRLVAEKYIAVFEEVLNESTSKDYIYNS